MATLRTNDYEVSPNGTTLTIGNTSYDAITTAGSSVSDNVTPYEGTFSGKFVMTGTQTLSLRSDITATGQIRQRAAFKSSVLPATNNTSILQTQSTGSNRGAARILTDGTWQLRNGSSSVWDSVANGNGTKFTAGHWYCVEHVIDSTNSQQRMYVWDENQALLEDSGWKTYNSGTFNQAIAGSASGNAWTLNIDGHIITDDASVSGLIGPRNVATNWTRTVGPDQITLSDPAPSVSIVSQIVNVNFETAKADGQSYVAGDLAGIGNLTGQWVVDKILTPYEGSASARIGTLNTNASILATFATGQSQLWLGIGINISTLPSVTTTILNPKDAATNALANLRITPTGQIQLRDGNTSLVYTSPGVVFPYIGNDRGWYWIEQVLDGSSHLQKATIYDYAGNILHDTDWQTWSNGATPVASLSAGIITNCNVQCNFDRLIVGISAPAGPLISATQKAQIINHDTGLIDDRAFSVTKVITDTLQMADNNIIVAQTIGSIAWASNPQDREDLVDAASVASTQVQTVNDLMSLDEDAISQYNISEIITDSMGLTDPITINRTVGITQNDDAGISDASIIVGKVYGVPVNDSLGLTDASMVVDHGIPQFRAVDDPLGITESFTFSVTRLAVDTLGLSDSVSTSQFTLTPTINDTETLGDSVSLFKNGQIVGTFTKQDLVVNWLRGLGYTGTLQDMQYKYLLDKYTIQFGAPTRRLTSADMQIALGLRVKWLLDIVAGTTWTVTINTDTEGLSDSMPALQGQLLPNEVLSGQDQTPGTTATTASFTPNKLPTGRLYYIIISAIATTAATAADPTSVVADANGASFTKLVGATTANVNCDYSVWAIDSSTISGAGTITITFAASQNTIQWKLHEYIGTKISATLTFGRKQAVVTAQSASTTPTVTLGAAPAAANLVLCMIVYNASNANTCVAGTGAQLIGTVLQATSDALQLGVEVDTLPTNLQTLGFTTGNASGKVLGIIELEAA